MYTIDRKTLLNQAKQSLKKNRLRYNEYYGMQPIFDNLYKQSSENSKFKNLYGLIASENNIMLAYRTIKRNSGSKTPGTNRHNIEHWENQPTKEFIQYIKRRLENYIPQKVRRKEIPKSNGKTRPLGIPCIEDRIIQQCIKQVLEPICEAKFHPHSYGFRPNRSVENAIAYFVKKVNLEKLYYVVDVDIKGFFDNIDHEKLIKQIWSLGIQDKRVLCIIGKMLKAEIEGEGVPLKGAPQGGILSPLLSNIVLNEFDWWISSQWETFETDYSYQHNNHKYRAMRETNLKEMYIVRYADDFKILCRDYQTAEKVYRNVVYWLKERLNLEVSPEKSTITNLKKKSSEFLGFKIKAVPKRRKRVAYTKMTDGAKEEVLKDLREQIAFIKKHPNGKTVYVYNRIVAGIQNFYSIATHISEDFRDVEYKLSQYRYEHLKHVYSKSGTKSKEYVLKYAQFRGKELYVLGNILYPLSGIKSRIPRIYNEKICSYTEAGRELLHTKLGGINKDILKFLADNPDPDESVEVNDNRLSLYTAQKGLCRISKLPLTEHAKVHRIVPKEQGGSDRYQNLILVHAIIYDLIWSENVQLIKRYLQIMELPNKVLKKINTYRQKIGNEVI